MAHTEFHHPDHRDDDDTRHFPSVKIGEAKTFAKVLIRVDGPHANTARIVNATMILELGLDELNEYIEGLSAARDFLEENDLQ